MKKDAHKNPKPTKEGKYNFYSLLIKIQLPHYFTQVNKASGKNR
jgi:hypothetical protein